MPDTPGRTIAIRLASERDAAAVLEIYSPVVARTATSFELDPPDVAEMGRRIRETVVRTPWLVCLTDRDVIGYAYANRFRERPAYQWTVEVSVYVRPGALRSGVGRALYTSLFEVLRLQGFRTAVAGMTLPNPGSEGLHRAMGFRDIGVFRNVGYKMGAWHDVAWMELALLPHIVEPSAPLPLQRILDHPGLRAALAAGVPLVTPCGSRGLPPSFP